MKSLYLARCQELSKYPVRDVEIWSSINKLIGLNVGLVDRAGGIDMPFNFKIYPGFEMPSLKDITFNLTYEDCCNEQAQYIIAKSKALNKPITVLYSGGIDSTLVLISLMKNLDPSEYRDRITVALSIDSMVENPNFYQKHIRNQFNIISSDNIGSLLDGKSIVVGGEHNDQLFGSDIIGGIYRETDFSNIHHPYTREFITSWFIKKGLNETSANIWFDLLDNQIKTKAECEVVTNYQFFWWYNFCFKWQNVYFRILTVIDKNKRSIITQEFINDNFLHFYSSRSFQLWSMTNSDKKILENWETYKFESKKVIFDFNKDEDYFKHKVKIGSLYKLFIQRDTAAAIDSNFNIISDNELVPEEFYNPNNSFSNY